MTAQPNYQRETIDLLERILDQVESIEKSVEGIRDRLDDDWAALRYANAYDQADDSNSYQ